jgi:CubicO group peptidase (beta-lactamase class C family)
MTRILRDFADDRTFDIWYFYEVTVEAGPMTSQIIDRRHFIGSVLPFIAAAQLAPGAVAGAAKPQWPSVKTLLDSYVREKQYAGIAVALSYHGSALAFPSAGTLAYDSVVGINRSSLFRIYSVTKPVTGIAAMMLVEDGTISLDQPVADLLPELGAIRVATDPANSLASRPAVRRMTMRHLLTHTSGLSNWQPALGDTPIAQAYRERGITPGSFVRQPGETWYDKQVVGLDAMIAGLAEVPLIAEPGTAWNYSMGLDVMGAVIERVSRMPLDRFMDKRIFQPLGMRSTGFQVRARDAKRLTTLYGNAPEGQQVIDSGAQSHWLKPPTLMAGGGGLISSAHDFIRFAQMLLNEGALDGVRVMKTETARLALSNLLPPGVAYPPTGGFGAGAGVVMPGVKSDNGPAGTYSAVGASSTLVQVDPAKRGVALFFAQYMPGRGVSQMEATRYRGALNRAIGADIAGK